MTKNGAPLHPIERLTTAIGSVPSLLLHTTVFLCFFALSIFHIVGWDIMLLVLTTLLSLEAIYLAIFIQMTVNRHSESLQEVEADIDEIQEDVEEISEDIEDMAEEEDVEKPQTAMLEELMTDLRKVLADVENLKKGQ
ncbi:MAG: hypothetical protein WAN50_02845 [Minisyncoccia bacterium]